MSADAGRRGRFGLRIEEMKKRLVRQIYPDGEIRYRVELGTITRFLFWKITEWERIKTFFGDNQKHEAEQYFKDFIPSSAGQQVLSEDELQAN